MSGFQQLPLAVLPDLPQTQLTQVQQTADGIFNVFENKRNFNIEQGNLATFRQHITQQLNDQCPGIFGILSALIAYAAAKVTAFSSLERHRLTNRDPGRRRAGVQSNHHRCSNH